MTTTSREKLEIDPVILAWFRARGRGWQNEIKGVLEFYIDATEHPASEPAPPTQTCPPKPLGEGGAPQP
jgi:hypothetical protein